MSRPALAQEVEGWKAYHTPHFSIYALAGTDGAGDLRRVGGKLEHLHARVLAPLRLPPTRLLYPLYPSVERFYADWWRFATIGHGDLVNAWGTIYDRADRSMNPYPIIRAVIADAFPRAIPLLRWGLGDALADQVAGIDAHRHVRALAAAGQRVPGILEIAPPSEFGNALPASYPVAVSFMQFLLERFGPAQASEFVDRVEFRYYDLSTLFEDVFSVPLADVESAWRARVDASPAHRLDLQTYLAVTRFVYRSTLAGAPSRLLLEPHGATVVTEAFRTIEPLRRLDLRRASSHMDAAVREEEAAERRFRLRTTAARGAVAAVIIAPIALAVLWLVWPGVRARLAERQLMSRTTKAEGSRR